MKDITMTIANNLLLLRKNANLTQSELAQQLCYSDKAISKWETGESLPSIEVLYQLAQFYGLTLNDLVKRKDDLLVLLDTAALKNKKPLSPNKAIISCLGISLVWILATLIFVYAELLYNITFAEIFLWAVPLSFVLAIIFNCIWGERIYTYIFTSLLVWTFLTCIFVHFLSSGYNIWLIYVLGAPIQIAIILWSRLKPFQKKPKVHASSNGKFKFFRKKKSTTLTETKNTENETNQ